MRDMRVSLGTSNVKLHGFMSRRFVSGAKLLNFSQLDFCGCGLLEFSWPMCYESQGKPATLHDFQGVMRSLVA